MFPENCHLAFFPYLAGLGVVPFTRLELFISIICLTFDKFVIKRVKFNSSMVFQYHLPQLFDQRFQFCISFKARNSRGMNISRFRG